MVNQVMSTWQLYGRLYKQPPTTRHPEPSLLLLDPSVASGLPFSSPGTLAGTLSLRWVTVRGRLICMYRPLLHGKGMTMPVPYDIGVVDMRSIKNQ